MTARESHIGPAGEGLAIVTEQLAQFGGVERIVHTLMARYPKATVVAGRFDAVPGFPPGDFESRARERGVLNGHPRGNGRGELPPRIRLVGPGGRRSHFLSPLYARRLRSVSLDGASTILSLGGMAWTLAAPVPAGSRHIGYVGGLPRPLYGHTRMYVSEYPLPLRPLLRAAVPGLRAHHRRLLYRPDAVVANAQCSAEALSRLARRPVGVVYPPVRTDYFTPAEREREHYLAVARLFRHKRVDVLVEAFRELPAERLVVAGHGSAFEELRAAAPPNVSFTGYVGDAELRELYRSSRALLTASVEEFGLASAEAHAVGVPVIGPRAGGSGEIVVDGETGVLFDHVDSDSVAAAVRRLERMRIDPAACRIAAERFSEARFVEQLEALLAP